MPLACKAKSKSTSSATRHPAAALSSPSAAARSACATGTAFIASSASYARRLEVGATAEWRSRGIVRSLLSIPRNLPSASRFSESIAATARTARSSSPDHMLHVAMPCRHSRCNAQRRFSLCIEPFCVRCACALRACMRARTRGLRLHGVPAMSSSKMGPSCQSWMNLFNCPPWPAAVRSALAMQSHLTKNSAALQTKRRSAWRAHVSMRTPTRMH